MDTVTRLVVQELLEAEQADYLGGRGRYERRGLDQRGSRNGYEPGRIHSAEAAIKVRVPQVRDTEEPYRSSLMSFLDGNSDVLDRLVTEMYTRGLSTRESRTPSEMPQASCSSPSPRSPRSPTSCGRITSLSSPGTCPRSPSSTCSATPSSSRSAARGPKRSYLWRGASTPKAGSTSCTWPSATSESEAAWTGFFRNLIERHMRLPTTVTTDGAPGMIKAVEVVFQSSVRIRCWFHRLSNIRSKLPDDEAAEVMAHLYAVRDAPTLDAARAAADRFENTCRRQFPAAVACFADDREALLAVHRVPVRHRIRVRTTNLAERSFEEERRRTKIIPRLMSEKATMKLAFATMIRSAERWCRV